MRGRIDIDTGKVRGTQSLTDVKWVATCRTCGSDCIGTGFYMFMHAFLAMEVPCARRTRCSSTLRARRANHSPQGVETGDLRSSRHMSQVNSDMLSANVVSLRN